MRVGVISDTHGDRHAVERCVAAAQNIDAWLHCGDCASDAELLPNALAVRGNCDGGSLAPSERVAELGGVRIFMCHGHLYGVDYSAYRAALRAEELNCSAVLFGHTHAPLVEAFGAILVMNPGSPHLPRGGSRASMGLLEIENRQIISSRIILV